jgi:hypothetical protein
LFFIIRTLVLAPGRVLQQKFVKAGTLQGHSEAEIVAAVGQPQSRSTVEGGYLLQRQASGYHCLKAPRKHYFFCTADVTPNGPFPAVVVSVSPDGRHWTDQTPP